MESSNEKTIYCRECGKEMLKDADFCESCGAPKEKREITYVKTRGRGNTFGTAVAIIMGGFFILVAIPVLFGGSALMGVTGVLDQGGGFIGVDNIDFETSTQMLIAKEVDIVVDNLDGPPRWLWEPDISDLVTIKIKANSKSGDGVFIGIVKESDANAVFGDAAYDQITQFRMEDVKGRLPYIEYRYHSGEQLTVPPTDLDIWVAEVSGSGEQTLVWSPEMGSYWVVFMNEDSSPNVDIEVGFSVKMPILDNIGRGLFLGGLVLLGIGVAVVYFGAIKPRY